MLNEANEVLLLERSKSAGTWGLLVGVLEVVGQARRAARHRLWGYSVPQERGVLFKLTLVKINCLVTVSHGGTELPASLPATVLSAFL